MKMAVFAYHHSECTLPLVKQFAAKGHSVDYYCVTYCRSKDACAFDYGREVFLPGIRKGNRKFMKPYYDYMESDRVNIFLVVLPPYALRYFYSLSRLLFSYTGRYLKSRKYDVINVVGQNRPLLDLVKNLGDDPGIYISLHEVTPHYASQRVENSLIEYLISKELNVITHSSASSERLMQYGAAESRTHVIPFGVFETYLLFDVNNSAIVPKDRYLLNFGNILPYKGLDVLYEAVQLLGARLGEMKIVVAGRGADPCLEKMRSDPRFIVINRYLSNQEVAALNKGAYGIVCPYKSASQSGIVSTSYLFGKPIVASDVGGFSEYIIDGQNGLLVPANDPEAVAESLCRLVTDESLYKRLSNGARAFSSSPIYSWDAIAGQYLSLFSNDRTAKMTRASV